MGPDDPKAESTIIPVMMTREQVQKLVEILPEFRSRVLTLVQQELARIPIEKASEMQQDLFTLVDSITDISIPDDPEFAAYRGQTVSAAK